MTQSPITRCPFWADGEHLYYLYDANRPNQSDVTLAWWARHKRCRCGKVVGQAPTVELAAPNPGDHTREAE